MSSGAISDPSPSPFAVAADLLDPPKDGYDTDPLRWVADRTGEHLWSKQQDIALSVRDHRRTAVRSCHDAGKSFTAARVCAWWIDAHPPAEAFVVTTAPTFQQVRAILWREIGRAHRKGDLRGRVNQTEWFVPVGTDEELVAYGRKPADYDPAAFQGIHARFVLVVIDEASGVPKAIWDAADTLVTNEDSRILAIGNPDDPATPFAECFKPGSGWNTIHIAAEHTPNFTGERVPDDLRPLLLSETWVEEKRKSWGEESPLWASKVRGEFPEVSQDTLVPLGEITRAQERTLEPGEPRELGVDVARFGDDQTVLYLREGPVVRHLESRSKQDTMTTAGRVKAKLKESPAELAKVDVIGIGAGVVDRLREQNVPVRGLNASAKPRDTERFVNARAEWYWSLRERFMAGEIDLDPADDELAGQLANLRYDYDSRGRIKIESKDDMKARGLPSPDRADAVMLAFVPAARPAGESVEGKQEDYAADRRSLWQ